VKIRKSFQNKYLILAAAVWVSATGCGAGVSFDDTALSSSDAIAGVDGPGSHAVGHSRVEIVLTSSNGLRRPIDVELWYPADKREWDGGSPAVYRSRLWGVPLTASFDALSYQTVSTLARDGVGIRAHGAAFPLVIHSHGNTTQPIDLAEILEIIASHGYVVAAPWHTRNTMDDTRIDAINAAAGSTVLACLDRLPGPCSDANAGRTVADRVLDLKAVLDNVGAYLGSQVDTSNAAIFGYSRGGVTAMAAAGGSAAFGITTMDSRVKGIFAWSGGRVPIMFPVDIARIDIPAILVTSTGDQLIPASLMKQAYDLMPSQNKGLFQLDNAVHLAVGSDLCDQMQAAGAIRLTNPRAFMENAYMNFMLRNPVSGTAYNFCDYSAFSTPTDITGLAQSIGGVLPTPTNVPNQLSVNDVVRATSKLTLSFFRVVLSSSGKANFSEGGFLNPQFALRHEPALATAEATYMPSEKDKSHK
jgi:dienelactone hydrolase